MISVAVPAVGDGWVCTGRAVKACYSDEKTIKWLQGAPGKLQKKRAVGPLSQSLITSSVAW